MRQTVGKHFQGKSDVDMVNERYVELFTGWRRHDGHRWHRQR